MALRSQISAIIANQLGNIQGQLESRIQEEVVRILSKFAGECPTEKELTDIIKVRNNLIKAINSFQKITKKFSSIPKKLKGPVSLAKQIIKLLKRNPIPVAIGIKPAKDFGGLISAKKAGYLTSQANRLVKTILLLDDLEDDLAACNNLLQGIQPSINNVKELLSSVDKSIQACAEEIKDASKLKQLLASTQPAESESAPGGSEGNSTYRSPSGATYVLQVVEDKSIDAPALRRRAVAIDTRGIVVLRGEPSFSSDTNILLEEIKFRIDNQLP